MRAVCIYAYGGPEVLVYEDAPCPRPRDGEVLIRVHAAGINPVDWKIREGRLKDMIPTTFPLVLGWDVSGVVETVGGNMSRLAGGDEVFSRPDISRDGAYAEYIVVAGSEVALKPKSIDHVHAAALPLAGLTAWQALVETGGISAGQRVLIHGAAGGVGHLAVQLAKWKGAHVIGSASQRNHAFLRQLGVDQVVEYPEERFEEWVQPVDVVLDTVGGETQDRSWKVLKRGGILVSIASPPSAEKAAEFGVRQAFVMSEANSEQLAEIAKLVDAEKLKAVVETILPLSDATRGQELSERGHTRGKIVLRVIEP
jgi:NADPH:quinone reductase-like Zn-dependent oxidoreductase